MRNKKGGIASGRSLWKEIGVDAKRIAKTNCEVLEDQAAKCVIKACRVLNVHDTAPGCAEKLAHEYRDSEKGQETIRAAALTSHLSRHCQSHRISPQS